MARQRLPACDCGSDGVGQSRRIMACSGAARSAENPAGGGGSSI